MTSMPDAVAAPSRPAPTSAPAQRGGSAGDDARDEDFAGLVDEAADEDPDDAARPDRLRKRKDPRPDDPVAAQGAIIKAVVEAGGADAPLMPWMVAIVPPSNGVPAVPPTPTAAAPEAGPDSAMPKAGQPAGIGKHPAEQAAAPASTTAPAAIPQPTPEPSAPAGPAGKSGPEPTAPADRAAQGSAGQTAEVPAPLQTVQATLPAATSATPGTAAEATPSPDGRESRRDESTDPRTAVRGVRGGRQNTAAGNAGQPATVSATSRPGQAAPDAAPVPTGRDTALPLTTSPTTGGSDAANTGLEAVPTLPAQAATQYAAAAASGRAATVHSPAMAQLAAPLVRVAESGGGEFHIDLAPAELGRIRVVADVSDGKVSLTVQAEQADTLALLRRDLTQLERALGDAGLSLDSSNLQFSLQGDGQSRGFAAPDRGSSSGGWRVQAEAVPEPVADRPMRPIDGLVDVTV
ncbi:flagellar hook-length control protein FliK [Azospirillum melinis]|uniref:Flagellar hook-length control protein FliK n=1 Tax=Azospirillum melinis TaxID=328839 RepID=A0ABX2KJW2_9PROT|nr:flagellar hook-length control protein FliK [Azospirillum melinis]MBP2310431.1 flagellar hook-length control protein FliK [Azospirillum melinis]NUB02983.1 flagellar hook-length control protein FliK [Azospirillum melinis]